jgi:hypothetical protein
MVYFALLVIQTFSPYINHFLLYSVSSVTIYFNIRFVNLSVLKQDLQHFYAVFSVAFSIKDSSVHIAPVCTGPRGGSGHFGSYVRSLSLHFCRRLFPGLV